MAIELVTYQTVAPAGVVIEDAGSSVFYPAGTVFKCRARCASIQRLLASKDIVVAEGPAVVPPAGPIAGGIGPEGPRGPRGAAGDRGEKGDQGDQGPPGPIGINWRGNWSPVVSYSINDGVSHLGSSFVAIAANLNDPPFSASWSVMAVRGGDGFEGRTDSRGLTDRWLAVKARQEAVPNGITYDIVRDRLSVEVQAAFDAMNAAGGPE